MIAQRGRCDDHSRRGEQGKRGCRQQKARRVPGFVQARRGVDQLTASFSALPALNDGFFDFWILIVSPVFGLRPSRAARSRTWKVPKPTRVTASPFFSALVMTLMAASTALAASALESSAASATALTNSPLFIRMDSLCGRSPRCTDNRTADCVNRLPIEWAA